MKILITTPILPPEIGGPATYTGELAKRLSKDFAITIITFTENPRTIKDVSILSTSQFKKSRLGSFLRQSLLFAKIIKHGKEADLIYSQDPLVVGLASVLSAKLTKKKIITKFVGDIVWEETERKGQPLTSPEEYYTSRKTLKLVFLQQIQALNLKLSDRVVVPSRYLKNLLQKYYAISESKIAVINNAVAITNHKPNKVSKTNSVIACGRFVPHKGFNTIIRAYRILNDQCKKQKKPIPSLLIIGSGPQQANISSLINRLGIDSKVKVIPAQTREALYTHVRRTKILVNASTYEGLSHTLIEAMLLGTPVIASDIPGNKELVKNGKTGLIVTNNPGEFAKAMIQLLDNEKLSDYLVENAHQYAKKNFNWETHIERLIHLFRQ